MTGQGTAIRPTGRSWPVWSTTAVLVVTDPVALGPAQDLVRAELDAVDRACSRFRTDSEIARMLARPDQPVPVSPLLSEVIGQALRVAAATDNLVDPTVAAAVIALGYDRDLAQVVTGRPDLQPAVAAPGSWRVQHDPARRTVTVPAGVGLDLGATAKPLAADRAARRVAQRLGCGALVGIGGDIAVAGEPPAADWQVDSPTTTGPARLHWRPSRWPAGAATSSTTVRRWRTGSGQWRHHIVDPRTGRNPMPVWRTVAVAAGSSVDANAAATAAIVLGWQAPAWLAGSGLPALLVGEDGRRVRVAGWPDDPGSDLMNDQVLWYASRATGAVSLVLFTTVLVLGLLTAGRRRLAGLPRAGVLRLHRNLALVAVTLLAVHVVSAIVDGYVDLGLWDVVVPFGAGYDPFWIGLAAVAVDLLLAIGLTSALRRHLPVRVGRACT